MVRHRPPASYLRLVGPAPDPPAPTLREWAWRLAWVAAFVAGALAVGPVAALLTHGPAGLATARAVMGD